MGRGDRPAGLARACALSLCALALQPAGARAAAPAPRPERLADGSQLIYEVRERFVGDLPEIRARGVLRVLVDHSHLEFYVSAGRPEGYAYETMMAFQRFLRGPGSREDRPITVLFVPTPAERIVPDLLAGKGDVGGGMLAATEERRREVAFSTPYLTGVDEVLVSHRGAPAASSPEDLAGRTVHVLAGSSFAQHLQELNRRLAGAARPPVRVVDLPASTTFDDLLHLVAAGTVAHTFLLGPVATAWAESLPGLRVDEAVRLGRGESVAWAVRPGNPGLLEALNAFMGPPGRQARLRAPASFRQYLASHGHGRNAAHPGELDRLQPLVRHFQEAGSRYGFDWMLLGAQAYQESHLDPSARSARGAVGLLQLLPATAAAVGFPDVQDPRSNILAGAAYLDYIRNRYFQDPAIGPDDRIQFALAAYNAGPARVRELRRRARRMGLDPNQWFGNVERAALHVTGEETVGYVGNISRYYLAYRLTSDLRARPD